MDCKWAKARIVALVDGELSALVETRVREHMAVCTDCAGMAAETERVKRAADVWEMPETDVWQAVRTDLAAQDVQRLSTAVASLRAEVRLLRAEVARLCAGAIASGTGVSRGRVTTTTTRRPSQPCLRIV